MHIRDENPEDKAAIFSLTAAAFAPMQFSNGSEPYIVDRLRHDGDLTLSLVATEGVKIVGQITFSPVQISGTEGSWFGLGPISVAVANQRTGIGSALIREGLSRLKALGASGCALIGNPDYYSRFGFQSNGMLNYEGTPPAYVQWLSFGDEILSGELKFSPAFSVSYEIDGHP